MNKNSYLLLYNDYITEPKLAPRCIAQCLLQIIYSSHVHYFLAYFWEINYWVWRRNWIKNHLYVVECILQLGVAYTMNHWHWTPKLWGIFLNLKLIEVTERSLNIICSSIKVVHFCQIGRAWLNLWGCHAHLNFEL